MQSREGSAVSYRLPLKWHAPIASVAALTAQPLAALPPYGCGVPFTGGERHAGWHYLRHKFIGARLPNLEAGAVGEAAGNLRVSMAVTTRKGHAASVRRQSRQRLRSDRRYRRNRCVPFYRQPVRVGSAAPGAACRSPTMACAFSGGAYHLTAACTNRQL